MNKSEKIILYILAAINFSNIMDFMIMMPLGPQLMRLFEIGPKEFSVIVSSYTFSAFASGMLSSLFIDRFDRRKSLMVMVKDEAKPAVMSEIPIPTTELLLQQVWTDQIGETKSEAVTFSTATKRFFGI